MHRTAVARGDALHHPSVAVVAGDVDGGVLQLVLDVELENLRILLLTGIGTNFRIVGLTSQAFSRNSHLYLFTFLPFYPFTFLPLKQWQ